MSRDLSGKETVAAVTPSSGGASGSGSSGRSGTRSGLDPGFTLSERYRLVQPIGAGGFGEVWRARHLVLERDVALKLLPAEISADEAATKRLIREAARLFDLRHPSIANVLDAGVQAVSPRGPVAYLAMDLLEGPTLRDHLAEVGALTLEATVAILEPVAAALDHAHGQRFVHLDVKPANVLFTAPPEAGGQPKLIDFGIAHELEETIAMTGIVPTGLEEEGTLGTPAYMSPEQFQAKRPRPAMDVWSTAVMAYQMLSDRLPFRGSPAEKRRQILEVDPDDVELEGASEEVEALVSGVLRWALRKDPKARPATVTAFVEALAAAGRGENRVPGATRRTVAARPAPAPPPAPATGAPAGGPPVLEVGASGPRSTASPAPSLFDSTQVSGVQPAQGERGRAGALGMLGVVLLVVGSVAHQAGWLRREAPATPVSSATPAPTLPPEQVSMPSAAPTPTPRAGTLTVVLPSTSPPPTEGVTLATAHAAALPSANPLPPPSPSPSPAPPPSPSPKPAPPPSPSPKPPPPPTPTPTRSSPPAPTPTRVAPPPRDLLMPTPRVEPLPVVHHVPEPTPVPTPTEEPLIQRLQPPRTPAERLVQAGWKDLGRNDEGFAEFGNPVDESPMVLIQPEGRLPFLIGKYEVSNGQAGRFMDENRNHNTPLFYSASNPTRATCGVTHAWALSYCRWVRGRLPAEAEWRLAALGTRNKVWPWGDDQPPRGRAAYARSNFIHNREAARIWIKDVESNPRGKSPFGIFNMVGNVAEYVSTERPGVFLVGGAWTTIEKALSTQAEEWDSGQRLASAGLRCACDLPP